MHYFSGALRRFRHRHISARTIRSFCDLLDRYKFNLEKYRVLNYDLARLPAKPEAFARHYLAHGAPEGRCLTFDCDFADVAKFYAQRHRINRGVARQFLRSLVASCVEKVGNIGAAPPEEIDHLLDLQRFGFRPFFSAGDSNVAAYALPYYVMHDLLPLSLVCAGGSARGLVNPNSRGQFGNTIHKVIALLNDRLQQPLTAIFCFGQVDVQFVMYYKIIESEPATSISSAMIDAFSRETNALYFSFLEGIKQYKMIRPCVAAIFPPSLSDAAIRSGYINASIASLNSSLPIEQLRERVLKFDFPDLPTRTRIHDDFNRILEEMCRQHSIPHIDVGRQLRGPDGLVAEKYMLLPPGVDHHLNYNSFKKELLAAVEPIVGNRFKKDKHAKPRFSGRYRAALPRARAGETASSG